MDDCCSICLDEFDDEKKIIKLKCNHQFHEECINDWLKKKSSCPYCRTYLKDTINILYKQAKTIFFNRSIIILPRGDSLEMKLIFPKKLFSKGMFINRFNLKSYTIFNNNKLQLEYFVKIPYKFKKIYLLFESFDDLQVCVDYFNKMFEYNNLVKIEQGTLL